MQLFRLLEETTRQTCIEALEGERTCGGDDAWCGSCSNTELEDGYGRFRTLSVFDMSYFGI
jgi:hypothetical protein